MRQSRLHTHGGKRTPSPGKKLGRPLAGDKPKVKVSFSLDADLVARFEKQARMNGLNKSDAIAQAIQAWLPLDLNAALNALNQFDEVLAKDDE